MTDISDVLAARSLILQRNAALRGVTAPTNGDPQKTDVFAAKLGDALQTQLAAPVNGGNGSEAVPSLGETLSRVNAVMEQEDTAAEAFERGETTDIAAVVLQQQKAGIAFETTLQIRNKLLAAYKDIMSMPV